jgi:hypothetical protein
MRRRGKDWWILRRWGRKRGSAFRMCVFLQMDRSRYRISISGGWTYGGGIRRNFPMQIKDHPDLLHGLKHRIIHVIILDAAVGVGGDATGVGFDACNASVFCPVDLCRGEGRGEVESH